jgi:hypothetical protein
MEQLGILMMHRRDRMVDTATDCRSYATNAIGDFRSYATDHSGKATAKNANDRGSISSRGSTAVAHGLTSDKRLPCGGVAISIFRGSARARTLEVNTIVRLAPTPKPKISVVLPNRFVLCSSSITRARIRDTFGNAISFSFRMRAMY